MATQQQVAHYQGLATQAQNWREVAAAFRAEQIEANRQQAARIAGLTWSDVACAIRALGMPEASEDFVRVCRALAHVVEERGFDNAEELLQSPPQRANLIRRRLKVALEIAGECAAELRLPDLPSEREQAEAEARDRAEARFEQRRDA